MQFQHTAARRRLIQTVLQMGLREFVSTHSRPKAAEPSLRKNIFLMGVSTHSRPKAADGRHLS